MTSLDSPDAGLAIVPEHIGQPLAICVDVDGMQYLSVGTILGYTYSPKDDRYFIVYDGQSSSVELDAKTIESVRVVTYE